MRPMTEEERIVAEEAMVFVEPAIQGLCRSYPGIRRQVARIDAVEVAQLAVCRAAQTYRPEKSKPTTYFSMAIRNALLKEIARNKRAVIDGPDRIPLVEVEALRYSAPDHNVVLAISALPDAVVGLIRRRYYDGHTLSEIARAEGCSRSTVRRRLSIALRLLRKSLESLVRRP
jgi:RNA polymerase sigma factor (sigma-70 family)